MFDTQKNSGRLENVDYVAMMQQAREERAKYLAMLSKRLFSNTRQFIERQQAVLKRSKPEMRINKSLYPNC